MSIYEDSPQALYPPDRSVGGLHFVGQDSPVKGLRIVEMEWLPGRGVWKWERFTYGPTELSQNSWIYLDAVPEIASETALVST